MGESVTTYKIGIDVGGTFTDLFLWTSEGDVASFKVLSTPRDPSLGVLEGLSTIAAARGLPLTDFAKRVTTIVHGTTVTTNAVLTRGGALTGLLTTPGVRDALEMRRGIREEQYDNRFPNVVPLVERHLRLPVPGRLDWRGEELEPLSPSGLREALKTLTDAGVEAVAICFMNAFANPEHERAAAEFVRAERPDLFVSVSSEVLPTIRFYDRVSTTALDAYTGPVLRSYLHSLLRRLEETELGGTLLVMQSSGGVAAPEVTARRPATTLLSGPAGGPKAAAAVVRGLGQESCLVVDMGGTSFDASLVQDGEAALRTEGDIERLRIGLPMLDITTIGAGGGSVGWIDAGGLLRMGPESAGADPGPACYGRGGERPTCTDADLVLGYLDPGFFAGGAMELSLERAKAAIEAHVATPLGLSVEDAAAGMYRVINANMAHGVREVTVRRGLDPREFPMVIAGGAGSLHACMIALELEIPTVVVPEVASILCASGMLMTDLSHDHVRSLVGPLATIDRGRLLELVDEMSRAGDAQLDAEGVPTEQRVQDVSLDLRYLKQYHEVIVKVTREELEAQHWAPLMQRFHDAHDALYGYHLSEEGTGLELINVRVRSVGRVDKPELPTIEAGDGDATHALKGERRAYVPEATSFAMLPVYDGHRLRAGDHIAGPALIERRNTTIFISASYRGRVDEHGTCVLELGEER